MKRPAGAAACAARPAARRPQPRRHRAAPAGRRRQIRETAAAGLESQQAREGPPAAESFPMQSCRRGACSSSPHPVIQLQLPQQHQVRYTIATRGGQDLDPLGCEANVLPVHGCHANAHGSAIDVAHSRARDALRAGGMKAFEVPEQHAEPLPALTRLLTTAPAAAMPHQGTVSSLEAHDGGSRSIHSSGFGDGCCGSGLVDRTCHSGGSVDNNESGSDGEDDLVYLEAVPQSAS